MVNLRMNRVPGYPIGLAKNDFEKEDEIFTVGPRRALALYRDDLEEVTDAEDIYTYKYKKETWNEFKLINVLTGEVAFLEFEKDDVIEYYFSGAPLKRNQWPVSPEEVEEMADEEEGEIYFGGKTFYYEDDYKVKFSRASNPEKEEKAYMYEFETDNGESLTYEKWDKNDFEVYFSKPIDRVEIVCLGGE